MLCYCLLGVLSKAHLYAPSIPVLGSGMGLRLSAAELALPINAGERRIRSRFARRRRVNILRQKRNKRGDSGMRCEFLGLCIRLLFSID